MAIQERSYLEIADALYALASYKQKSDIPYIKAELSQDGRLFKEAFYILGEYPDSSYFPLLEKNCKRMYRLIYKDPIQQIGRNQETALSLLNTMASYKTKSSALILDTIIHRSTTLNLRDSMTFRNGIYDIILKNACPEYASMIKEMSGYISKKKRDSLRDAKFTDSLYFEPDTSYYKKSIEWPRNRWSIPY